MPTERWTGHRFPTTGCLSPPTPLPSKRAIVRYLDHVDRRIRRYVTAKRKLIALLEEEKQAVINQAVTRGLDPNVRLKPSGVEWLGDVPEQPWERCRSLAKPTGRILSSRVPHWPCTFEMHVEIRQPGMMSRRSVQLLWSAVEGEEWTEDR